MLFDTGQGLALLNNAAVLGIDLSRADAIVLSHGHFDHVGGLEAALAALQREFPVRCIHCAAGTRLSWPRATVVVGNHPQVR